MTKYNIIGDIHGRDCWKDLVDPDRINIFLGDYMDPYDDYSYKELKNNFLDIMSFAKTHPETILLLGNHDLHYIHEKDNSRMDMKHKRDILDLFLDNIHLFHGVAYAIGDDILVSHAGFTCEWMMNVGYTGDGSLLSYEQYTNMLLWKGYHEEDDGKRWFDPKDPGLKEFTFQAYAKFSDYFGTSPGQSPVWIRPTTLEYWSIDINKDQIVGHTQVPRIVLDNMIDFKDEDKIGTGRLILCDCLGYVTESLYIDYNGSDDYIYKINKK